MEFCPHCNTILSVATEDGYMQQRCSNCGHKEIIGTGRLVKATNYKFTGTTLNPSMIYDRALAKTTKVKCVRAECDSNNPTKLGQVRPDGVRIQTDILLTNHISEERVMTYICRICGCAFGPSHVRPSNNEDGDTNPNGPKRSTAGEEREEPEEQDETGEGEEPAEQGEPGEQGEEEEPEEEPGEQEEEEALVREMEGDLLEIPLTGLNYIVHQANCNSTGASGLAKDLFAKYPRYNIYTNKKIVRIPGQAIITGHVVHLTGQRAPGGIKANETAQQREEWFTQALVDLHTKVPQEAILWFPYKIGCGIAGGDWSVYLDLITTWSTVHNRRVNIVHPK